MSKRGKSWCIELGDVHVPAGTAMDILVDTIAFPLAGTVVSSELYRSYPAAKAEPRVGAFAFGESSWICSDGGVSIDARDTGSVAILGGDLNSSTDWWLVSFMGTYDEAEGRFMFTGDV